MYFFKSRSNLCLEVKVIVVPNQIILLVIIIQINKIKRFYLLIENYLNHVLSFTQPPRRKLLRSNVLFIIFIETSFRFMSNHHQVKINNII